MMKKENKDYKDSKQNYKPQIINNKQKDKIQNLPWMNIKVKRLLKEIQTSKKNKKFLH